MTSPLLTSPLLTEAQLSAEESLRTVLTMPQIAAARATARTAMLNDPIAQTRDGAALLERTLDLWLARAILMTVMRSRAQPAIVWAQGIRGYAWRGGAVPASGTMIDNPDYLYRGVLLDGAREYILTGRAAAPATQLTVQIGGDHDGRIGYAVPQPGSPFAGLPIHDSAGFKRAADGSFSVTLGPDARGRTNFIALPAQPLQLTIRDIYNDWSQHPHGVHIARADGADDRAPLTDRDIGVAVGRDFPEYAAFWTRFKDWYAKDTLANVPGTVNGGGGPGYNMKARFRVGEDEALVITTRDVPTAYFGVQIADLWLMAPDPVDYVASRNRTQSARGADGTYTYVVALRDPGVANWLDTAGMREGFVQYRWVGTQPGEKMDDLVQSCTVMKIADVAKRFPLPPVSASDRAAELGRRAAQWQSRVAS